jgi:flagellar hook protein FlgE
MSILRTLNIGVSGLTSNSDALGVASDNIANVNTVGFKRSRAVFEDVLGRSVASFEAVKGAGSGSRLAHVEQVWTQGALVTTDAATDLAIQGDGFFVVQGNQGGAEGRYYTRAGQFHIDNTGRLVTADNMRLQGYTAAPNGTMGATIGDLIVDAGTIPASATTSANISANLDSNSAILPVFDPLLPDNTSNFANTITVYDSLGNSHEITMYYHKNGSNSWDWHAMIDGMELTTAIPGPAEIATGALTFTTNGELDTESNSITFWDFIDATQAQSITFDFGTSITTDLGLGLDGTTQFAAKSSTVGLHQDGFGAGSVTTISIAGDGTIYGSFSNGQQRPLGQIVTADFANVNGLERTGQGLWISGQVSGEALIGPADAGGRGAIVSGTLEQANVDLGTEFVNLIAYQRGFQANSRVITTADEMYGELVNIKR